ncbi:MAG: N-acetylmuramoyl-L-alanine amidase [Liquorilactobacillus nagelii]|jgi:N-acetylmuramoyl-L-alanine amidase|uniref:N-acetylmuramoyl-L-alanine amidase n=1 Tax=Liquorilactobacillus nagelii TaxID=82688 RepID=A0A3S6QVR4_9LACO|nr:N-acetylmuramoyl-L-alanine amidase [Liquorilactobacillus nagelii]AUJ32232.1 N-acetylmuramoyl-L-alanine amidase [Liquorilactobacillus nagelii]KRL40857.1 N-acetylmuramoyl-L-alanine amidase [Liquorilactobacillus nagelii DSM 13675]MCC7615406.1 N-acetylmuramoyl-L-alanine amidase [Liquorilactobacillus nagelii]MCI1632444.1 N-acetylmuramoyl-L-alanine amidase [Liquorilactobacillus nagelii]MCI1699545.1 N-acetylmuramoyl-L-alanine amidase [Liquorilactobacillus nagelii]
MRRSRKQHNSFKISNLAVLSLIIAALIGIIASRTFAYFKQVEVNVSQVELRKGPGVEYQKTKSLSRGTRLTVLRSKYHWYYVRTSQNNFGWVANWNLNPQGPKKIHHLNNATIVLDPGHGGSDSGALSSSGKMEKTYTLKLAKEVAQELRARGAKVYLTRTSDRFVSLAARPNLSNEVHADAFISFHFDSSPTENSASGVTTYYYHRQLSYRLASSINQKFNNISLENRGIEFGNFEVIRDNDFPAILLEMGYINTDRDFQQIRSSHYRTTVANDVVAGLNKYFESN